LAVSALNWRQWQEPFHRERDRIRAEIVNCRGLMPLLMKQRNGAPWTTEERTELIGHLRRLSSLGPYLLALIAPGSFVLLPLLAWWLDRRRKKRSGEPAAFSIRQ
jgi:hypothetical protein